MNELPSVLSIDPNVAQVLRGFEARLQNLEHRVHSLEIGDTHGTQLIQSIYDDLIMEEEKGVYHTPAPSPAFAIKEEEPSLLSPPPQLNAFLPPLPPSFLLSSPSTVRLRYSRAEIVAVGQQTVSSGLKKLQNAVPVGSPPKQPALNVTIDNMNRSSSPEWERSAGRSKSFERSHSSSQDSATFQHSLREYQHQQKRLSGGSNAGGGGGGKGGQQQTRQAQQKESSRPPRTNSNSGQQQQQKKGGNNHRTVTRTSDTVSKAQTAMDGIGENPSHHSELRFGMLVQVPDSDSETP